MTMGDGVGKASDVVRKSGVDGCVEASRLCLKVASSDSNVGMGVLSTRLAAKCEHKQGSVRVRDLPRAPRAYAM
jgi:hypothetical protein